MKSHFKMDSRGRRQLLNADFVSKEMGRRADRVARAANANAPVGDTGELSNSHIVVNDHTDRARAAVVSTADHALVIEARTGYLSRSLEANND